MICVVCLYYLPLTHQSYKKYFTLSSSIVMLFSTSILFVCFVLYHYHVYFFVLFYCYTIRFTSSGANNWCTKAIVDKENGIYYFREDFGPLFFALLYCLTKNILQWIYYKLLQVYFVSVLSYV